MTDPTRPVPPDGEFTSDWLPAPDTACPQGVGHRVEYRIWEDWQGHEDHCHRCLTCGFMWWTEGPDA